MKLGRLEVILHKRKITKAEKIIRQSQELMYMLPVICITIALGWIVVQVAKFFGFKLEGVDR